MAANSITTHFVGRLNYTNGWRLQQKFARAHLDYLSGRSAVKARNVVLLAEHEPVYTVGIRNARYSHEDEARLRALGADFYKTNRGGLITFHGPGQLVAYPILNLKQYDLGVRAYICKLEQTIISLCQALNIEAQTSPDTGVWVNSNKLAAIGIHGSRYITTHGIGLNCNTDLDWFSHIVPCGIENKGVTSLSQELKRNFTIDETIPLFIEAFKRTFCCHIEQEEINKEMLKDS